MKEGKRGGWRAYSSCIEATTSFVKAGEVAVTPHLSATLSIVAIDRIGVCVLWNFARGTSVAVLLGSVERILAGLVSTPRFNVLKAPIGVVYVEKRTVAFGTPPSDEIISNLSFKLLGTNPAPCLPPYYPHITLSPQRPISNQSTAGGGTKDPPPKPLANEKNTPQRLDKFKGQVSIAQTMSDQITEDHLKEALVARLAATHVEMEDISGTYPTTPLCTPRYPGYMARTLSLPCPAMSYPHPAPSPILRPIPYTPYPTLHPTSPRSLSSPLPPILPSPRHLP